MTGQEGENIVPESFLGFQRFNKTVPKFGYRTCTDVIVLVGRWSVLWWVVVHRRLVVVLTGEKAGKAGEVLVIRTKNVCQEVGLMTCR